MLVVSLHQIFLSVIEIFDGKRYKVGELDLQKPMRTPSAHLLCFHSEVSVALFVTSVSRSTHT
jgi:hypothetical protein